MSAYPFIDNDESGQFPAITRALGVLRERLGERLNLTQKEKAQYPVGKLAIPTRTISETIDDNMSVQIASRVSVVHLYSLAWRYTNEVGTRPISISARQNLIASSTVALHIEKMLASFKYCLMRNVLLRMRRFGRGFGRMRRHHQSNSSPLALIKGTKQQVIDKWGKDRLADRFRNIHLKQKYFSAWYCKVFGIS
jgi:hypothetical protein